MRDFFIYLYMKNIWRNIKQLYCKVKIFRSKWTLFKTIINDQPWDFWYIYKLEREKLNHVLWFFKSKYADTEHERDIQDLQLCINLLDIFLEDKKPKTVNIKNYYRFFPKHIKQSKTILKFFKEHPEDVYRNKALYIYHKIRERRTPAWWD